MAWLQMEEERKKQQKTVYLQIHTVLAHGRLNINFVPLVDEALGARKTGNTMHADMFIRRARHILRDLFDSPDYEVANGLCMLCVSCILCSLLTGPPPPPKEVCTITAPAWIGNVPAATWRWRSRCASCWYDSRVARSFMFFFFPVAKSSSERSGEHASGSRLSSRIGDAIGAI